MQIIEPEKLDYDDAIGLMPGDDGGFEAEVLSLVEAHDFWQDSRRYIGPRPAAGRGYLAGMQLLQQSFAPILKISEVLRRHTRGVTGRKPNFQVVLDKAHSALADEADGLQVEIWDERGEHVIIEQFMRRLRAIGRAYLRYDIPPGLLSETQGEDGEPVHGVSVSNWQDAYRMLYMELVPDGSAYIYTDRATMEKTAFYSYEEPRPDDMEQKRQCVQISWLEPRDEGIITRVRVVRDDGSESEWELDTGGRLLVVEAEMEPLITPDLLRLQDILSSLGTMIKINSDVAGFPEQTVIDIDKPLFEQPDPNKPGEMALYDAEEITSGPRTMKFLYSYMDVNERGEPILDERGSPSVRAGSLHYREPVSSQPLREDGDWFEKHLYQAVNQEHIVARRSATTSADALIEMRADYADSLLESVPYLEQVLRSVYHARLCAAAYLANDRQRLEIFKAGRQRADVLPNAGPISSSEADGIITRYREGLLSRESAMVMLGVDDVDSETELIRKEQMEELGDGFGPLLEAEELGDE